MIYKRFLYMYFIGLIIDKPFVNFNRTILLKYCFLTVICFVDDFSIYAFIFRSMSVALIKTLMGSIYRSNYNKMRELNKNNSSRFLNLF